MESKSEDIYTWAMLCHLASLAGLLLAFIGLPPFAFINIIAPLIVWLAKRNESEFIDDHGKESLNFQISMTIYGFGLLIIFVALIILLVLFGVISGGSDAGLIGVFFAGIGLAFLFIVAAIFWVLELVIVIFAAVKAKKGQMYRYPLTLRLL